MQIGARHIKDSESPTSATQSLEQGQARPAGALGQLETELPHVPDHCSQPEHSCKGGAGSVLQEKRQKFQGPASRNTTTWQDTFW